MFFGIFYKFVKKRDFQRLKNIAKNSIGWRSFAAHAVRFTLHRLFESFRAQRSGVEKSVLNRFLHFGPLCGPPVEMTMAHVLVTFVMNHS
jgi:hypothetical protein